MTDDRLRSNQCACGNNKRISALQCGKCNTRDTVRKRRHIYEATYRANKAKKLAERMKAGQACTRCRVPIPDDVVMCAKCDAQVRLYGELRPWDEVAKMYSEANPHDKINAHQARSIANCVLGKLRYAVYEAVEDSDLRTMLLNLQEDFGG